MNFERRIKKLNARFGQHFGFGQLGPNYQWVFSGQMFYWLKRDSKLVQLPHPRDAAGRFCGKGLWVPSPIYERKCWADRIGLKWLLAVYKLPVSETEWTDRYGHSVPWPSQGEMQLIENVCLHPGPPPEEPDDDLTDMAIWSVRRDLAKSFEDFKEQGDKIVAQQMKDATNAIKDELDDLPLVYIPGTRGGDRLIFSEPTKKEL